MLSAEFRIQEVAASEGSLFPGDESGVPVLCAFNRKGGASCDPGKDTKKEEGHVIWAKVATLGSVVYSFLFFTLPVFTHD